MNLSGVILTKNEEGNIEKCINSLIFCEEILVIDDFSTDKTVEIAKKLGVKIIRRDLNGDFSSQRNFGLEKARGKWVLFIDADEIVPINLKNEIIQLTGDPLLKYSGFYFKRQDYIWNKLLGYGEVGNRKIIRLVKKGKGKWKRKVHEYFEADGLTFVCKNPLYHYPHKNLREFIAHINFQSSLHAIANKSEGKRSSIIKILIWPSGKFIQNLVFKKGFMDGTGGFVHALMLSLHSFLSWGKLWVIQKKIK